MRRRWDRWVAFAHDWWPDVLIALLDPICPALLVLGVRAVARLFGGGRRSGTVSTA